MSPSKYSHHREDEQAERDECHNERRGAVRGKKIRDGGVGINSRSRGARGGGTCRNERVGGIRLTGCSHHEVLRMARAGALYGRANRTRTTLRSS